MRKFTSYVVSNYIPKSNLQYGKQHINMIALYNLDLDSLIKISNDMGYRESTRNMASSLIQMYRDYDQTMEGSDKCLY